MNEQKSLLLRLAETIDQHYAEQRAVAPERASPKRSGWLRWLGRQMVPNIGTLLLVVILLLTVPSLAAPSRAPSATSTSTISYQGRLADSGGTPITGKQNMEFRLYDTPTGGAPLWTEMWTGGNAVDVSDGLFNVMLGSIDATVASAIEGHDELYLGITVGTDSEMEPRVQLGSVPFSMQAMTVPDGSITTDKIADGAVTQAKLQLNKYRFSRGGDDIIHYVGPTGQETTLDASLCTPDEWCCNLSNTICYYSKSGQDSQLAFSLEGADSFACTLLHEEDDWPLRSKGIYFATDTGNNGPELGVWTALLSRESVQEIPIITASQYWWICF